MNERLDNNDVRRGAQLEMVLRGLGCRVTEVLRARFGATNIEVGFDPATIVRTSDAYDACRIRGTATVGGTYWAVYVEAGEIHLPGRDDLEVITRPAPAGLHAHSVAA